MKRPQRILWLVVAACLVMAAPAAAQSKNSKKWGIPPRSVHVVNTPGVNVMNTLGVNVLNSPAVSVPEGVAITNAPEVFVANAPSVVVVNDPAYPIPVLVQNPPEAGPLGLSEVSVVNGPDQPVPVRQASAYHSIFLRGLMPSPVPNWTVTLAWPQEMAFLVKTVAVWSETKVSVMFPVVSVPGMTANDFIWLCPTDRAGGSKVENLQGGILLQESGVSCRIDKIDPDYTLPRQYRLLITGELVPK